MTLPVSVATARRLAPAGRMVRWLRSDWRGLVGFVILGALGLLALLGPLLFPGDPTHADYSIPPQQPPSAEAWLGTDQAGRDILLGLVHGAAPSMGMGLAVGVISSAVALLVGLTAGYLRGFVDDTLSLLTNVVLVLPGLPLMIVLAAILQTKSNLTIVLILGLSGWAGGARVIRSQVLALREREFVAAARLRGESAARIVVAEVLPNMVSIAVSVFIGAAIGGVATAAGLQFLGLGDINEVTWFSQLYWAQNFSAMLSGAWWTFIPPGLCIALFITALSLINYALDGLSNPSLRSSPRRSWRRRSIHG